MKTLLLSTLSLILFGAAVNAAPNRLEGARDMTGAELSVCRAETSECLIATSARTTGSVMRDLHRMKNPKVRIENRKSGKTRVFEAPTGYVDMDMDQLVLVSKKKGAVVETVFNLRTLERTEIIHR